VKTLIIYFITQRSKAHILHVLMDGRAPVLAVQVTAQPHPRLRPLATQKVRARPRWCCCRGRLLSDVAAQLIKKVKGVVSWTDDKS
jgi:hypothetical protein